MQIPTLAQLYETIKADLESELNVTIPVFGKSFLRAFAMVQAAKLKVLYLLQGALQKNIFVDTADPESQGGTLERFGRVKLNRNPFPATSGFYEVTVTGEVGAVINANQTFKSDDSALNPGKLFILDTAYTLTGISGTITIRALETGLDSKLSVTDTLTSTAPIALVNSLVTVSAETVPPQSKEDIEAYRRAVIQSFRLEPQGGSGADYRLWAAEVQGVRQSFPYTDAVDINEVNLFIESPVNDSTDGKGTPTATILTNVNENITLPTASRPSRLPLTATLNVLPITPLDIDITINSFTGLTPDIETAIEQTIELALDSIRPFVGSIDVVADKNDIFSINKIISLILEASPGAVFGAVVLEVNGNVENSFTFTQGNIPYLNSIIFV